jgi:hypothetical protein
LSKGFRRPSKTPLGEVTKLVDVRDYYPKKDISFICQMHKRLRQPSTDEIFEQVLGENTILQRLENVFGNNHPSM